MGEITNFFLDTDKGIVNLHEKTLMVFLDETGGETLTDPNCPVFGLGGCVVLVSDYERLIAKPWFYMKNRFFGGSNDRLHASEISPNKEQIEALNHFFSKFMFGRIAATLGNNTCLNKNINTYEIVAVTLWYCIRDIAKWYVFDTIAIIFEESQRTDSLMRSSFTGYDLESEGRKKEKIIGTMKKDNEPGLEVADFIIHTAGGQARRMNEDKSKINHRKDYDKIFNSIDKRLVSFRHLTLAEYI